MSINDASVENISEIIMTKKVSIKTILESEKKDECSSKDMKIRALLEKMEQNQSFSKRCEEKQVPGKQMDDYGP